MIINVFLKTPTFLQGENLYIVIAVFLGFAGGLVGSLSYQKSESLIGDALGHSVLPGIMLAFVIFKGKDSNLLSIGAIVVGLIAYILINIISSSTKFHIETIMAVILSSFFALGILIYNFILNSTNISLNKGSKRGLRDYIFGQIIYSTPKDAIILISISILFTICILLLYKELKTHLFDICYSNMIGYSSKIMTSMIVILTMILIAFGLKVVGVILISSIIIAPATAAAQWTKRFSIFLILSSLIGAAGSGLSIYLGFSHEKTISGRISPSATIVIALSVIALFSILVGPRGFIVGLIKRLKAKKNIKNNIYLLSSKEGGNK